MRNWHHTLIRLPQARNLLSQNLQYSNNRLRITFLFVFMFMFLLGNGQRTQSYYDSICDLAYKSDSILYLKLKKESKHVNYNKLTEKIINDINWSKLNQPNLIFTVIAKTKPNLTDVHPSGTCDFYRKSDNPNYNDSIFWTKKSINLMVNKYKKNIIPTINDSFIYNKTSLFNIIGFNNLITRTIRQKVGSFNNGKKFHYFNYDKENELILSENEKNYDYLQLIFTNELENKVIVIYNYKLHSSYKSENVKKKYQYINKEWVELIDSGLN